MHYRNNLILRIIKENQLIIKQEEEHVDMVLFGDPSLYSLFRRIIGFFENQSSIARYKFKFMRGIIKNEIDNSVMHIFKCVEINNEISAVSKMKACKKK